MCFFSWKGDHDELLDVGSWCPLYSELLVWIIRVYRPTVTPERCLTESIVVVSAGIRTYYLTVIFSNSNGHKRKETAKVRENKQWMMENNGL